MAFVFSGSLQTGEVKMNKRVIFFNDKFVPEEEAVISVTTHAFNYGTGCFEGIRAYFNEKDKALYAFRLEDHYKRLLNSCKVLFIHLPFNVSRLAEITKELIQKNFTEQDIYIRPLAFKSDCVVGNFNLASLKDGLVIFTTPLGRYLKGEEEGVKANISSWTRVADNAIPPRAKITGAYINTALAKTESSLNGFGEALFLDKNGHIVEGSAENIFIVKDGQVITPPVSDDILQGITRDTVIKICREELGVSVLERSINRSEIYSSDEVILAGTGAEISPVVEVDHRVIGDGKIGPVSAKVKEIYFQIVHGEYPKYSHLLTKITAA